jgi:hypothetical protein
MTKRSQEKNLSSIQQSKFQGGCMGRGETVLKTQFWMDPSILAGTGLIAQIEEDYSYGNMGEGVMTLLSHTGHGNNTKIVNFNFLLYYNNYINLLQLCLELPAAPWTEPSDHSHSQDTLQAIPAYHT